MGRRLLAYYAHTIDIYGTPLEVSDVRFIEEELGYAVRNPNTKADKDAYAQEGMAHFCRVVEECDVVVFRAFPDGYIGAGIWKEVQAAVEVGKLVFEIPTRSQEIELARKLGVLVVPLAVNAEDRVLDVEETRKYLKGYRRTPDNLGMAG